MPNGSVQLFVVRTSAGTDTTLASGSLPAGTFVAGSGLTLRVQAVGTSPTALKFKAWKVGTAEPAAWQLSVSDSAAAWQKPGGVGVAAYVSGSATNAPAVVSVDNLSALSLSNQAPVAAFTSTVNGLAVTVDGSGSSDGDGTVQSYAWNFGDGATATGAKPQPHTYEAVGTYQVSLTVTDDAGTSNTITKNVLVREPDPARVFRLVVLPDTQLELKADPAQAFTDRMRWIAANAESQRIKHVIGVGDLVDTDNCGTGSIVGTAPNLLCNEAMRARGTYFPWVGMQDHYQYVNASNGLAILDQADVDYSLPVGNHDSAAVCGGPACGPQHGVPAGVTTNQLLRTTTMFDETFPQSRFPGALFYRTDSSSNMARKFQAGGLNWLVLSLELWPRPAVINWAKSVVAAHPDHNVIVTTHHYLNSDGSIAPAHEGYGDTSPRRLFDDLISAYPNVRLVLSGHEDGPASRRDNGTAGNPVVSMLNNWRDPSNAQTMVITVDPDAQRADVVTYRNAGDPELMPGGSLALPNMEWVPPGQ